jgi:hypothetical protein
MDPRFHQALDGLLEQGLANATALEFLQKIDGVKLPHAGFRVTALLAPVGEPHDTAILFRHVEKIRIGVWLETISEVLGRGLEGHALEENVRHKPLVSAFPRLDIDFG